jgi:hypothetical protein
MKRSMVIVGVSRTRLAEVNGITDLTRMYAGQVLDIAAAR